jgi:hypothetical protein
VQVKVIPDEVDLMECTDEQFMHFYLYGFYYEEVEEEQEAGE